MASNPTASADRIRQLRNEVQEKRVNAATLHARQEELQKRLDEATKECRDTLGIEPEELEAEESRLSGIIDERLGHVQSILAGAGK